MERPETLPNSRTHRIPSAMARLAWARRLLLLLTRLHAKLTLAEPALKLIKQEDRRWEIELQDLKAFDDVMSRDVLNAFCRCFVHADRLNSTINCMHTSEQHHGGESVAYVRDLNALVWFTVGTLRELARAIRCLRSALAKQKLLDPKSDPWIRLSDLEKRWEDNEFYRKKRDFGAFHVDRKIIDKGLNELVDEETVTLAEGQGDKLVDSRLVLGFLALHNGLDMGLDQHRQFLEVVKADHVVANRAIQSAFILASEAKGIPYREA